MLLKNEKGLTLIEVLAATVILGIVVIAFMNVSGYTSLSTVRESKEVEARAIAEEHLSIARTALPEPLPMITNVDDYTVTIQQTDMNQISNVDEASFLTKHESLHGIVLQDGVPKMVTVTVSWEN